MVLFPIIVASAIFMFFLISIICIVIVVNKVGICIVSARMRLKNYGLLWIPFLGSWYEATVVSKFYGKKSMRFIYFLLSFLSISLFLLMMAIPYEYDIQPIVRDVAYAYALVASIIKAIIRIVAMKRQSVNLGAAICINIFIPYLWSYFMIGKAANIKRI